MVYLLENHEYKQLQKIIGDELKRYVTAKVQIENKKELDAAGIDTLFPSFRSEYKNLNELKVKHIDRAIEALDVIERQIIELKYLQLDNPTDTYVYMEIGITKTEFYRKKKSAIVSIATSLSIM